MDYKDAKDYQRQTGCSWPEALDAVEPDRAHNANRDANIEQTVAVDVDQKQEEIGRRAINISLGGIAVDSFCDGPIFGADKDAEDETIDGDEYIDSFDDFAIPDEPESFAAIATKENEASLSKELECAEDELERSTNSKYKTTEKFIEDRADSTGQSYATVLLELGLTNEDVEPTSERLY
jgi:hypothetical protein